MSTSFSKLMLGTVQFGLNYGIANTTGQVTYEQVKEILTIALDNGITALDTAAAYGESETVLGRAMAELGIADKMAVVSKIRPIPADSTDPEAFILESLQNSLKNLKLDVLPLALFHREDDLKYLPILEDMIKRGYIRAAGASLDSLAGIPMADKARYLQVPHNVLDHRFDELLKPGRLDHAFIRSAYLQGLLVMPEERVAEEHLPLMEYRHKLEALGLPMKELCMRYLFSLPGNISVLTGVDTPAQLKENIAMANAGALPADLFKAVRETVPMLPEAMIRPNCWRRHC